MRIDIKKHSNLFVFVATLAGVRLEPHLNEGAQRKLLRESGGALTYIEKQALDSFARIFSTHEYNRVEACFIRFDKKRTQKELVKDIGKENTQIISDTSKVFSKRFTHFWKKEKIRIEGVKKYLRRAKKNIHLSSKNIDILCGHKKGTTAGLFSSVHLLFGGDNSRLLTGWYSSFGGTSDLVLEYSPGKTITPFITGVLLHEAFHVALHKNRSLYDLLIQVAQEYKTTLLKVEKTIPAHVILEECFLSVFAPEGVLVDGYRKTIQEQKHLTDLLFFRRYCAREMKDEARRYIKEQKKIDEVFLSLLVKKIEKGVAAL